MAAFQELAQAGCSFQDALLAVYELGAADARGVQPAPRKKVKAVPPCPHAKIVDAYHEKLPQLPGVKIELGTKLWAKRVTAMNDLWKWVMTSMRGEQRRAETAEQGVQWFMDYFDQANGNDFLMGRVKKSEEHRNWKPDFDYLLTAGGFKQVFERSA